MSYTEKTKEEQADLFREIEVFTSFSNFKRYSSLLFDMFENSLIVRLEESDPPEDIIELANHFTNMHQLIVSVYDFNHAKTKEGPEETIDDETTVKNFQLMHRFWGVFNDMYNEDKVGLDQGSYEITSERLIVRRDVVSEVLERTIREYYPPSFSRSYFFRVFTREPYFLSGPSDGDRTSFFHFEGMGYRPAYWLDSEQLKTIHSVEFWEGELL